MSQKARIKPAKHHMDPSGLETRVTDRKVKVRRCSVETTHAIAQARRMIDGGLIYRRFGCAVARTLLVFVDDRESERVARVVFALANKKTLVADVDENGDFLSLSLHDVDTRKRLFERFMWGLFGMEPTTKGADWYTFKVYARNLTCYA